MKRLLNTIAITFVCCCMSAHGSFDWHKEDMYAVLGIKEDARVTNWMKYISSTMIDKVNGEARTEYNGLGFYDHIKAKYPPFKCTHRLLFHWGFNSLPWSEALDNKVVGYGFSQQTIDSIKADFIYEQKQRNHKANEMTEQLFGFASGGKDAALANALVSIMYDVHLIGDYQTDNSDLNGLQELNRVIGDLINSLNKIDKLEAKPLIKLINAETEEDEQLKADYIMEILYQNAPDFFKRADEGRFFKRIQRNCA